eukprot:s6612_g1.t1
MGYSPIWGQIALLEDEVILCYAEDVRHCFHIFSPSPKWRGYFVIGKVAASSCFNDGCGSQHSRPRVKSLGAWRGSPPNAWSGWASRARDCHSFYVDNYDGFKVVAACDMGIYEGRPSDAQLQLREVFKVPKKAAEGTLAWSSLGAEQLGDRGLVGSARKLRRAVLGATLRILCAEPGEPRGSQELLSVVGKAMHSDELLMIISSLPMNWMDQRTQHVYATDASLEGGGACVTTGLSARGLWWYGRRLCGYVLTFGDVRKITFEDVKGWRRSFPKVTKVIFGGGWPGHPAEGREPGRQAPWELVEIYENLLMKPEAIDRVTSKLGCGVFFVEGAQVMLSSAEIDGL